MAFYGNGIGSPGSYFGGYAGGYSRTAGGMIIPHGNPADLIYSSMPGMNLPNVDPNNYPGVIHFGPPTMYMPTQSPLFPMAGGYIDPSMAMIGSAPIYAGF